MPDHTPHQKKIIERYYGNRDAIMLSKLAEIVSELTLADTDAKRDRLWGRADKAMAALRVPESTRRQIVTSARPDILARHLRGWLEKAPD